MARPQRAAAVLAAEATLRRRLLATGHPFAAITGREVVVDFDHQSMAILWRIAAGPAAVFAAPQVGGTETVGTAFLERRGAAITVEADQVRRLGGLCLQVLLAARKAWDRDGQAFSIKGPSEAFVETTRLFGAEGALLSAEFQGAES